MTIFNSFIVFSKVSNSKFKTNKIIFSDFKIDLAEEMLETVTLFIRNSGGRPSVSKSLRL